MSDIDLDGVVEGVAEVVGSDGCANIFIAGFNWFPVPTILATGSMIAHSMTDESAPIFHGVQDVAAFYAGAAVGVGFLGLAKAEPTFRNRLLATFTGCALFATSALMAPNYLEKWFGKDDVTPKTERAHPAKDSAAPKPAAAW